MEGSTTPELLPRRDTVGVCVWAGRRDGLSAKHGFQIYLSPRGRRRWRLDSQLRRLGRRRHIPSTHALASSSAAPAGGLLLARFFLDFHMKRIPQLKGLPADADRLPRLMMVYSSPREPFLSHFLCQDFIVRRRSAAQSCAACNVGSAACNLDGSTFDNIL